VCATSKGTFELDERAARSSYGVLPRGSVNDLRGPFFFPPAFAPFASFPALRSHRMITGSVRRAAGYVDHILKGADLPCRHLPSTISDQSQDREGAWSHRAAVAARTSRSGDRIERLFAAVHESAIDVVDGARFRHRSAIGWFVEDESHEGSRPHANYHDRFGYRQERVSGSRD